MITHLYNIKTGAAYCGVVGANWTTNQFEATCALCEVLNQYGKFEERTKAEFEEAKKKEEGKK